MPCSTKNRQPAMQLPSAHAHAQHAPACRVSCARSRRHAAGRGASGRLRAGHPAPLLLLGLSISCQGAYAPELLQLLLVLVLVVLLVRAVLHGAMRLRLRRQCNCSGSAAVPTHASCGIRLAACRPPCVCAGLFGNAGYMINPQQGPSAHSCGCHQISLTSHRFLSGRLIKLVLFFGHVNDNLRPIVAPSPQSCTPVTQTTRPYRLWVCDRSESPSVQQAAQGQSLCSDSLLATHHPQEHAMATATQVIVQCLPAPGDTVRAYDSSPPLRVSRSARCRGSTLPHAPPVPVCQCAGPCQAPAPAARACAGAHRATCSLA
jgi:hypothetical protein